MKYILTLILGISIGIGGEFLIPVKYRFGKTSGCMKDGPYVLLPRTKLKVPDDKKIYDLFVEGYIPSYRYLLALATRQVYWLSSEDCIRLQDEAKE